MPNAAPLLSSRLVAVPDVNVLVSSLISRRDTPSPPARILSAWRREEIILTLSLPMIDKVDEVLRRPALFPFLSAHFSPEGVGKQVQEFLLSLRRQARITPGALDIQAIEADPEDDTIITAAVEGKADCIISGDRHLKDLGAYQNIPILSPSEFVTRYNIP